jgi:hypothetical protein
MSQVVFMGHVLSDRYFEVAITKTITSEKITSLISKFCVTHGLPLSIHTDNGR